MKGRKKDWEERLQEDDFASLLVRDCLLEQTQAAPQTQLLTRLGNQLFSDAFGR